MKSKGGKPSEPYAAGHKDDCINDKPIEPVTSNLDSESTRKADEGFCPKTESPDNSHNPSAFRKAADWASENPGMAICYGLGAASLALVASPTLVSAPLLSAVGFGAQGVVANSAAAAAHASIGNVVAPSLFATLQSAGAAGYGLGIVNGAVQGGAAVSAAASFGRALFYKRWFGKKGADEPTSEGIPIDSIEDSLDGSSDIGDEEGSPDTDVKHRQNTGRKTKDSA